MYKELINDLLDNGQSCFYEIKQKTFKHCIPSVHDTLIFCEENNSKIYNNIEEFLAAYKLTVSDSRIRSLTRYNLNNFSTYYDKQRNKHRLGAFTAMTETQTIAYFLIEKRAIEFMAEQFKLGNNVFSVVHYYDDKNGDFKNILELLNTFIDETVR